eukprot:2285381-Rhodomonas_salina.2
MHADKTKQPGGKPRKRARARNKPFARQCFPLSLPCKANSISSKVGTQHESEKDWPLELGLSRKLSVQRSLFGISQFPRILHQQFSQL